MLITALILLGMMFLGFPIYLCLLLSSLYLLVVHAGGFPSLAITAMFDGVNKFTLTAIPFFMLAGCFMQKSSMTKRLVGAINPWFVKVRGGIGIVAVFTNEIFGAMSGSSAAAAGTIGRALYEPVKEANGEKFSLGLFTSCGSLAIIMPPSICMILFACSTNTSIGQLFLAGVVPALITGVVLSAYIVVKSKKIDQSVQFNLKDCWTGFKNGFLVLLMPLVVLGGIYLGVFSPTEAGAIAAVYSLLLPLLVYREFKWADIVHCLKEAVYLTGQLFILVSVSTIFSQALAFAKVPALLSAALSGLSPLMFFILLNIILLIVGCFFDTASAVLIIAPVIAPLAAALGIDLIHLGLVFTFNLAIGMFTPPFGLNIFVIQSIFKKPLDLIARSIIPFFFLYLAVLILLTYVPQLYMWLPKMAMGRLS